MRSHQKEFIEMILAKQVLRFGDFTLKSGRTSPYFFNAGLINDGGSLARLGACYAQAIVEAGMAFDMLFGPAYKGIPLATATAVAFAERHRRNVPIAYNRKEVKAHGEGGMLVGAPLDGRVLIVDDVLTAGTAVRESIEPHQGAPARSRRRRARPRPPGARPGRAVGRAGDPVDLRHPGHPDHHARPPDRVHGGRRGQRGAPVAPEPPQDLRASTAKREAVTFWTRRVNRE